MRTYIFFLVLGILMISCKNNSEEGNSISEIAGGKYKIDQLQWLLGTWIHESGNEFSQETWSMESKNAFSAFSFIQVNNQTVFAETMALEQKGKKLLLTVATPTQNANPPVTFILVSTENGRFTFENKQHVFPERIIYTNPTKDSLHAWIEGNIDGEKKKIDFYFFREK